MNTYKYTIERICLNKILFEISFVVCQITNVKHQQTIDIIQDSLTINSLIINS